MYLLHLLHKVVLFLPPTTFVFGKERRILSQALIQVPFH